MTPEQEITLALMRGDGAVTANPNLLRQGARGRAPVAGRERPLADILGGFGEGFHEDLESPDATRTVSVMDPANNPLRQSAREFGRAVSPAQWLPTPPGLGAKTAALLGVGKVLKPTKISKLGELTLERLRHGEGRTGDVSTVMTDIQTQNVDPKVLAKRDAMMRESPAFSEAAPYLQPRQLEKATGQPAKTMALYEQDWPTLPSTDELATVARAGEGKRGWYRGARETTAAMFPDNPVEQTRFGKGMAALSPQTSVESNAANMVPSYFNWKQRGSPRDEESIHRVLAENVQSQPTVALGAETQRPTASLRAIAKSMGAPPEVVAGDPQALRLAIAVYEQQGPEAAMEVLKGSVLDAWKGNFVRAMRDEPVISGPKVNSFGANLDPQNPFAGLHFTGDTWDAMLKGWLQKKYAGQGFDPARLDPGYSPGYSMSSAKTAATADRLGWLPEEVQETTWSWTKPVGEGKSGILVPQQTLMEVPDFQTLLRQPDLLKQMPPEVRGRLENFTPSQRPAPPTFAPNPGETAQLENAQRRIMEIQALRREMKAAE